MNHFTSSTTISLISSGTKELVPGPQGCRGCLDRGNFFHSFMYSDQSVLLIFTYFSSITAWAEHKLLELAFLDLGFCSDVVSVVAPKDIFVESAQVLSPCEDEVSRSGRWSNRKSDCTWKVENDVCSSVKETTTKARATCCAETHEN